VDLHCSILQIKGEKSKMELISQKQYESLVFAYDLEQDYSGTAKHREEMVEKGYKVVSTYLKSYDHVSYVKRVYVYRKEI
jgi:hypothetical protein